MSLMIARSATAPRRRRGGRPRPRAGPRTPPASRRSRRRRSRRSRSRAAAERAVRGASTPSPGSRRPGAPGASLSATCRPVMRAACSAISSSRLGVSQTCTLSTITPTSSSPASSSSAIASPIVERNDDSCDSETVRRLEPEPHARGARGRGHLAQALDARSRAPRLGCGRRPAPSGRATEAGSKRGEARHARAQRLDALGRIGRALHAGHARAAGSTGSPGTQFDDAEAARAQQPGCSRRRPRAA